ncbi:Glycerol-3-phosphate dehydrogenase [NAD(P)+] [Nymphon striatum]|nr:Glycerol-3-phosphate dehydrogenase [NAD(P)+] [Nymphon striatum]
MNPNRSSRISVYGAGSWGTALALQLARNGLEVMLWDYVPEHIKGYDKARENTRYLPGIPFPDNLHCTDSLEVMQIKPLLTPDHTIVWATKGLELGSGKLLHEVLEEELGSDVPYGLVSGPTFASEVARGLPSAMTAAASKPELAHRIAEAFQGGNYRVYTSNDVLGVELGGAVKNVLAIAAGISDGLGFGANARAAIITRGLAEIMRLSESMGAEHDTIMGLSGVGDLDTESAIEEIGQAVEGAKTSQSIGVLAKRANVDMPICGYVNKVIYENLPPKQAVKELLAREIAAGEVVERPASVVKELLENSIDAGSTKIEIDVEQGGVKRIRIRDDGKGIPKEELPLALSRHATSKIASLDDLEHVSSLGFRGEALPSIASVSRMTVSSKTEDAEQGWMISPQHLEDGSEKFDDIEPVAQAKGTTIDLRDLFYNVPARRKFLKTENTELKHLQEVVKKISLSNFPD